MPQFPSQFQTFSLGVSSPTQGKPLTPQQQTFTTFDPLNAQNEANLNAVLGPAEPFDPSIFAQVYNPEELALMQLLESLRPGSVEAAAIEARLTGFHNAAGVNSVETSTPETPQEANAALNTVLANLDPNDDTALAVQARIAALQAQDSGTPNSPQIVALFNQLATLEPESATAQVVQAQIAALQAQDSGTPNSPQIATLFNQLATLDPESTTAQVVQAQIAALQAQEMGTANSPQIATLFNQLATLEPESTTAQALQAQIAALQAQDRLAQFPQLATPYHQQLESLGNQVVVLDKLDANGNLIPGNGQQVRDLLDLALTDPDGAGKQLNMMAATQSLQSKRIPEALMYVMSALVGPQSDIGLMFSRLATSSIQQNPSFDIVGTDPGLPASY